MSVISGRRLDISRQHDASALRMINADGMCDETTAHDAEEYLGLHRARAILLASTRLASH